MMIGGENHQCLGCARSPLLDPESETGSNGIEGAGEFTPRYVNLADLAISSGETSVRAVLDHAFSELAEASPDFPLTALFESSLRPEPAGTFTVIGTPGGPLLAEPQPGDVICRRSEGGFSHASIIVGTDYWPLEQAEIAGLIPESNRLGVYVQVVEGGAFPHTSVDRFARLLTDSEGRVPPEQMVMRPQRTPPGGELGAALGATHPASLRSDPDYKRWIQQSLNQVLGTQLAVDGILGTQSVKAVRQFQQQRALVVDGVVGPITERALIEAGAPLPPPRSGELPTPPTPPGEPRIDPRDERVDVTAKFALQRMVKRSDMRADAVRLIDAIHSGKLAGIFGSDLLAAVKLAQRHRTQRWQLVPHGEDAALVLDPADPLTAPPTIIFRRLERFAKKGSLSEEQTTLHKSKPKPPPAPQGEVKDIPPERLDAALQKASQAFDLWKSGQLNRCELPLPVGTSKQLIATAPATPLSNIVPPMCGGGAGPQPPSQPALKSEQVVNVEIREANGAVTEFSHEYPIDPTGVIEIPTAGLITARGLTLVQLRQAIFAAFHPSILVNPTINVALTAKTVPYGRTIRIGDALQIRVLQSSGKVDPSAGAYTVDPLGNINFPFLGSIVAAGKTLFVLENEIETGIRTGQILTNGVVHVSLVRLN